MEQLLEVPAKPIATRLKPAQLDKVTKAAKLRLLDLHYKSRSGHVGGNFSCIDALLTLFHQKLQKPDRFILSKGHSAAALYVSLWSVGQLQDKDLDTYGADNSLLAAHPSSREIPGVLFSTGSLGHGPSLAAGLALAARHQQRTHAIYCLCSDGEWQEGSCWEALIFAAHHKLNNLTFLIDQNGLQGFGRTEEVISCADLGPRLAAFGVEVLSVDGHDKQAIQQALDAPASTLKIILLHTIKGKDLPFADTLGSHYLPLTEAQYNEARAQFL